MKTSTNILSGQAFLAMNTLIKVLRYQALALGKKQFKRYMAIFLFLVKEEIGEDWLAETESLIQEIRDFESTQKAA